LGIGHSLVIRVWSLNIFFNVDCAQLIYNPHMARPFPVWPRGVGRKIQRERLILGCPRICPRWEIDALRALTKPQFKQTILHRSSMQIWPKNAASIVGEVAGQIRDRLGFSPKIHFPDDGDYFLFADFAPAEFDAAKAIAVTLSNRFEGLWFMLDRLLVKEGRFYRRDRRVRFTVAKATNIHVPQPMRNALRGVI
jgi:hypothetical protein